jgi:hypothetical protein
LVRRFGESRIGELNLKRVPAGDVRPEPLNESSVRARSGGERKKPDLNGDIP